MIPKEQYGRANGMMSLVQMGPGVFAPMLAGAFLPVIGLTGILSLDVATFILAIAVLLFVPIPRPLKTEEGTQAQGNILKEAAFGFHYIFARQSLLGLQLIFFFGNLCTGIAYTVVAPMVLLRTGNDSASLGIVQSAGAVGGVAGSVVMSAWGGFKRRVHGVLAGWIVASLFFALVGVGDTLWLWVGAMAASSLFGRVIEGSNQAIWQEKVARDLQGRVFGWPKNILHHAGIDGAILDIVCALKPQFAIVDGIVGMEGDGPIMGTPKNSGVLVMGRNFPADDATCARIMGINPCRVPYLAEAWRLGPVSEKEIIQVGENLATVRTDFKLLEIIPAHRGLRL